MQSLRDKKIPVTHEEKNVLGTGGEGVIRSQLGGTPDILSSGLAEKSLETEREPGNWEVQGCCLSF